MKKVRKAFALVFCCVFALSTQLSMVARAEEVAGSVDSAQIVHNHNGSASVGGGCYNIVVCGQALTSYTSKTYCNGFFNKGSSYVDAHGNTIYNLTCKTCGRATSGNAVYASGQCDRVTSSTTKYKCTKCGRSGLSSGGSCPTTSYTLACGLTAGDVSADVYLVKSRVSDYVLSVDLVTEHGVELVSFLWSDGSTGSSVVVTGNQEYTCQVGYSDHGNTGTVTLSYVVDDFDSTPPVVSNVNQSVDRCTSIVVDVIALDDYSGVNGYKLDK